MDVLSNTQVRHWLGLATAIATIATIGSLWFSLGLGLVPCKLCWYQRILMYPLVVILGVATLERRAGVFMTVLPLTMLGTYVATRHSVLQTRSTTCGFGESCGVVQWQSPLLGLSIPNLSLLAFFLVTLTVVAAAWTDADGDPVASTAVGPGSDGGSSE